MLRPPRNHRGYAAFLAHRLSGLALAVFLPVHFLVLGLALEGAAALDEFLVFTDLLVVRLAECLLIGLLAIHLTFGVRLLLLELRPWRHGGDLRAGWVLPCLGLAGGCALVFLLAAL